MVEIQITDVKKLGCKCDSVDSCICNKEKLFLGNTELIVDSGAKHICTPHNEREKEIFFSEEDLDNCIAEFMLKEENIRKLFNVSNDVEDISSYISAFIDSSLLYSSNEEMEEVIKKQNSTFYSFLAEGLQVLLLSKYYNTNFVLLGYLNKSELNIGKHGADCCLYSEEKEIIIIGEAKFYKNYTQAVKSIKDSLVNSKNKLNTYFNAINSNNIIFADLRDAKGLMIPKEILKQNTIISGFILHETNKKHENIHEIKTKNYLTPSEMKQIILKETGGLDANVASTSYFHVMCSSKESLIKKVVNVAYGKL